MSATTIKEWLLRLKQFSLENAVLRCLRLMCDTLLLELLCYSPFLWQHRCHKPPQSQEMSLHACMCACERTLASWWTLSYLLISSPVCPHVSEFHYYLTMANKQFAPLDGVMHYILTCGWVTRRGFLCLSSSRYGEESAWRSSTDKTEAYYLLPALWGSTETGKVTPWPNSLAK